MQARVMNPGKLPSEAFGENILGMGAGITSDRAVEQTWLTLHGACQCAGCAELPGFAGAGGGSFFAVYHDVAVAAGDGSPLFAVYR